MFEIAQGSGTITTLASFNGTDGLSPNGGLVMDSSGNLYGTTAFGDIGYTGAIATGDGSVFEIAQGSGAITTLESFNGTNGWAPLSGLIVDSSGNLYGTTTTGGANGDGTVFELTNGPSFAITGPSGLTAGTAGTYTITALNADGTTNTNYSGTVQISSSDAKAVLPGNFTISGGTGTFTATLKTAGTQSITATDINNPSMTGLDSSVDVSPAAASTFSISAPTSVKPSKAFSETVTALDAFGNVATGYTGTIHFTSSDSTATLPANYTFTSGDAGVHTFSNKTTLKKTGTQTITATDTLNSGLTGSTSISVI